MTPVGKALWFIESHFAGDISLGDIAEVAGVSRYHVTRAFGEAKNLLLSSSTESLEGQLEKEARAMARVTRSDDAWNAMRAVLAKQKPSFQAR